MGIIRKKIKSYILKKKEEQDYRILDEEDLLYTYEHIETDINPFYIWVKINKK